MEYHEFSKKIVKRWEYCGKCGLIALRNEFTRWCISRGCDYKEDPGYPEARLRLTRGPPSKF